LLYISITDVSFSQNLYLDKIATVSKRTYTYQKKKDEKTENRFLQIKKSKRKLPLLLYVHGRGFSRGKRNDKNIINFGNNMAARGYAVASISYHLTWKNIGVGCNTKYEDKIKAFDDFSEDINFAVK